MSRKQDNNVYSMIDSPVIQPFSFPKDTRVGQRTSLVCTVKEGSEPLEFSWLKDDRILSTTDIEVTKSKIDSILRFNPIQSQNGGNYTCIVKNPVGSASHSTILFIERKFHPLEIKRFSFTHSLPFLESPSFVKEPNDISGIEGQEVRVECQARGQPQPKISWRRKEGQSIFEVNIHNSQNNLKTDSSWSSLGSTLHIPSLTKNTVGSYECIASNGIEPTAKKSIFISVKSNL